VSDTAEKIPFSTLWPSFRSPFQGIWALQTSVITRTWYSPRDSNPRCPFGTPG
jgi:hypothetical protein